MRSSLQICLLGALGACTPDVPTSDPLAIRASAVRAHMEFLADDLLEGRDAGTRGYDIAAQYVASEFRAMGLEPAGTDGFFQHVPLRRATLVPGSAALTVTGSGATRTFTDADHMVAYPSLRVADQRVTAKVVFVGYGIVSPTYQRDDYADLDVRDKFVLVLGGPPTGLPGEVAAHLGSAEEQAARAAERGAAGMLLIYTPALEARFAYRHMAAVTHQPTAGWADTVAHREGPPELAATGLVDSTAAAALLDGAPLSYNDLLRLMAAGKSPAGFPLDRTVTLTRRSTLQPGSSANVAGMLPGSDPTLAREIVVLSGHLDHVGIGVPKNGDSIYNGALDNASGIAGMLEVARALAAQPTRPRRSILFLAVTAEEKGLVGSDYFARRPTVTRQRIVANVNFDGAAAYHDFVDVVGIGGEHSTLGRSLERAAKSLGVRVSPDPIPEQSLFTRSDHYSFVRQGVPAIFVLAGFSDGPGKEEWDSFGAEHLHQPSDDLRLPIDYAVVARFAELFRRLVVETADAPERPRWYERDFFGDHYAPDAPKVQH